MGISLHKTLLTLTSGKRKLVGIVINKRTWLAYTVFIAIGIFQYGIMNIQTNTQDYCAL